MTLHEALIDEVRDLYHAEKQLVRALPKLARNATSPKLRDALTVHLEETKGQIELLEQIFDELGLKPRAKACAGMAGIIEEGNDMLKEDAEGAVLDAMIIAAAQRAEHYEIGAYGTAAEWAKSLGLTKVSKLLGRILGQEEAADKKLSMLAERFINPEAASATGEDDE
jgi:ferritin-like metal-binding protein YciE